MAIKVTCPECFRDYQIPDQYAGKKVKCKGCGAAIRVEEDPELEDTSFASPLPTSFPASPPPRAGSKPAVAKRKPTPRSTSNATKWILGILAGGLALIVLCCGGTGLWIRHTFNQAIEQQAGSIEVYPNQPDFGAPESLFPLAQIPVPQFPELGEGLPLEGSQIVIYNVDLGSIPANADAPGTKMTMRVYVPPGDHAPQSLPAVLVAPAGTTLLTGMALDDSEYHDETLPYAEAGMVVIHYSLDGDEFEEDGDDESPTYPYALFRAACAGVVNTRNALEFARAKLPMVDPNRIFTAGHSSAGTLSLLAAEHEPRIAGAIAYAPATDVKSHLAELADVPLMGLLYPKLKEFVTQSSPDTHIGDLKVPVFLFHAKDDSNVPFADSQKFADALNDQGKDVTFESSPTGDHYDAMISDGIPKAIEWLKPRTGA